MALPSIDYGTFIHWAGNLELPTSADVVATQGGTAYIITHFGPLYSVDIQDPSAPSVIDVLWLNGPPNDIVLDDQYAFLTDGNGQFHVINSSDPSDLEIVASVDLPGHSGEFAISGVYAFVTGSYQEDLQVVDISNPNAPIITGSLTGFTGPTDIEIGAGYLYVVDSLGGGLHVVDINTPSAPVLVLTHPLAGYSSCIQLSGELAYVGLEQSGIQVIDLSSPATPVDISVVEASAHEMVVLDDMIYSIYHDNVLRVVDVRDPTNATLVGHVDVGFGGLDIAVADSHAFVAAESGGMHVFDVSYARNVESAGQCDTPGFARDLDTENGFFTVVADDWNGVLIVATGNGTSPSIVGQLSTIDYARSVVSQGYFAFVADYAGGLHVVEFGEEPDWPYLAASVEAGGLAVDIDLSGDYIFLAERAAGLEIFDVSDHENPFSVASINPPGEILRVHVEGMYAYLAAGVDGMTIVDVTIPTTPLLVSSIDLEGSTTNVTAVSGIAALSMGVDGVLLMDVEDPNNPAVLSTFDTPGYVEDIVLEGALAYVADGWAGVHVLDVSNPSDPTIIGSCTDLIDARGLSLGADGVHVADGEGGLKILFKQHDAGTPVPQGALSGRLASLHGNHPNPFNPMTSIRFELAEKRDVSVEIYDLRGRYVRGLVDECLDAGVHAVTWDGRSDSGSVAAAGVYLYRLEVADFSQTRRMTLLK